MFANTGGIKGDTGDTGEQGIQGIQGIQGESGSGFTSQCKAYASESVDTIVNTDVKVPIDTIEFDVNSEFDTVNKKWICKDAGKYLVTASISLGAMELGNRMMASIFVNGVLGSGQVGTPICASNWTARMNAICVFNLVANDYVELFVFCNIVDRVVSTSVAATWLSVVRVG